MTAGRAWEDYTRENARLRAELDDLRHEYTDLSQQKEFQAAEAGGYADRARKAEATIARVRDLHQRNEDADYCDLCSNHGDITWPCATIAALDRAKET